MSSDIFFDEVSGELGLGFDLPENGDSIVTTLKKGNFITKEQVFIHIDTGIQNPDEKFRSQVSIGGYEPHFLFENKETFYKYNVTGDEWNVEVRGFIF
jgi:hypothetical protein